MIAQTVTPETDPCQLALKWTVSLQLARALVAASADRDLPFTFTIISGYRSCDEQAELALADRTTLPCCGSGIRPCSTHTTCPATGADLWPSVAVTNPVKAHLGRAVTLAGLRWGGGSPLDSDGFPSDWNHVDLGRVA